jgi:tRNA dimethylallyltransferase
MEVTEILADVKQVIQEFRNVHPTGICVIRWATATGKTKLSLELAKHFVVEIIGADSRQLFRGMDIGTDKVSQNIRNKIIHHQIDIINPDQHYTAGQWKQDTEHIVEKILEQKKIPLIVGGTGLYIDTIYKNFSMPEVLPNYTLRDELMAKEEKTPGILREELATVDPVEAKRHHPKSLRYIIRALEIYHESGLTKTASFIEQKPKRPILMIGLWREKEDTNTRINKRIDEMFDEGLIDEVQWLLDQWYSPTLQSMQGIGYKEVVQYLQWNITKEECIEQVKITTHQLAKRQRTWFRRYIADAEVGRENIVYSNFMLT